MCPGSSNSRASVCNREDRGSIPLLGSKNEENMKGYIPSYVSRLATMAIAIPIAIIILIVLWIMKTLNRGDNDE